MKNRTNRNRKFYSLTILCCIWLFVVAVPTNLQAQTSVGLDPALKRQSTEQIMTQVGDSLRKYEGVNRVAILKFANDHDGLVQKHFIETLVELHLYQVIEREHLDALFAETEFHDTDIINPETAVEAGKIAGAEAVFYGEVNTSGTGSKLSVTAFFKMIKVTDGTILWSLNPTGTASPAVGDTASKYAFHIIIAIVAIFIIFFIIWRISSSKSQMKQQITMAEVKDKTTDHHMKALKRMKNVLQEALKQGYENDELKDACKLMDELFRNLGLIEVYLTNNRDKFDDSTHNTIESKLHEIHTAVEIIRSDMDDGNDKNIKNYTRTSNDLLEDIRQL